MNLEDLRGEAYGQAESVINTALSESGLVDDLPDQERADLYARLADLATTAVLAIAAAPLADAANHVLNLASQIRGDTKGAR